MSKRLILSSEAAFLKRKESSELRDDLLQHAVGRQGLYTYPEKTMDCTHTLIAHIPCNNASERLNIRVLSISKRSLSTFDWRSYDAISLKIFDVLVLYIIYFSLSVGLHNYEL